MTDMFCSYGDDRDGAIVACLYDDADGSPAERARFEAHLQTCARCRADVAALRGVRAQLARWSPPEPSFAGRQSAIRNPQPTIHNPRWREFPAWAQVAAALLFLGVSAGVANLDVRYDRNGFRMRTGWSKPENVVTQTQPSGVQQAEPTGVAQAQPTPVAQTQPTPVAQGFSPAYQPSPQDRQTSGGGSAPWRADLAALERQLKTEFRATQASATAAQSQTARAVSASDADIPRRVRALVEESEKRQQRELALRIAELLRDVNAQRQADLVKIDRTLGVVQNSVGIEVMKNRQQINQMDLLYRASQRQ